MSASGGSAGSRSRSSVVSGHMSSDVTTESTRRRLTKRQADMVHRLTVAAVEELRNTGFADLTVRNVAARAGVAPATAYTYFSSKNHLITEVFWRRLNEMSGVPEKGTPSQRVVQVLREIALLVVDEPELASACTTAMLGNDPDVQHLRLRIGTEMRNRLETALGEGFDPRVRDALEFAFAGAMMHAGMGYTSYEQIADRLASTAELITKGRT
jgi:AcrR family transcriptional regulator